MSNIVHFGMLPGDGTASRSGMALYANNVFSNSLYRMPIDAAREPGQAVSIPMPK